MKRLCIAVMLLIPLSAGAAMYSWTDASGTIHFTDDLGAVPKKDRAKALKRVAEEEASLQATPVDANRSETQAPEAPAGAAGAPSTEKKAAIKSATPAGDKITPSTRFGDRSAEEWQVQFKALRAELAALEQKRVALKQETGDGKKLLTRTQITDINTRDKQLHTEYEAARLRFNTLVEQANKAGLPSEFAQ